MCDYHDLLAAHMCCTSYCSSLVLSPQVLVLAALKVLLSTPFAFAFSRGCRLTPSPTSKALCYQMILLNHAITRFY
jgi:hypothetical protein